MFLLSVNVQWMEHSPRERPFFDHNCSNITLDKLAFTSTRACTLAFYTLKFYTFTRYTPYTRLIILKIFITEMS